MLPAINLAQNYDWVHSLSRWTPYSFVSCTPCKSSVAAEHHVSNGYGIQFNWDANGPIEMQAHSRFEAEEVKPAFAMAPKIKINKIRYPPALSTQPSLSLHFHPDTCWADRRVSLYSIETHISTTFCTHGQTQTNGISPNRNSKFRRLTTANCIPTCKSVNFGECNGFAACYSLAPPKSYAHLNEQKIKLNGMRFI